MAWIKSLSVQVLIALAAGLALGALATGYGEAAREMIEGVEALGGLWLNALRMTVIPLIFCVLVTGIAQMSDAAATGRLAARALAWFAGLLTLSALLALLVVGTALDLWPVSAEAAQALRAGAQAPEAGAPIAPDFAAWLKSLAPPNPIAAAAEDAVLPIVVFAVFTGFALTRLPDSRGRGLLEVIGALGDAMILIVRWVLLAAPIGVFALGLGVGLRAGVGAAGVLAQYVIITSLAGMAVTLVAYALGPLIGRAPLGVWARATAPVMAAAFATQSSLACLPAMIERTRDVLGAPAKVANLVLPLAVAIFRMTSPAVNLAVCLFVAEVMGIEPTPLQYAGAVAVALAVSVGSVGLPGQVSFIVSVAPICLALGLPIDLLPILLAVEVVPDIFRTLGNVTGDMAVTTILARDKTSEAEATQAESPAA